MTFEEFKPFSNIYGISGTSYLIQLGMIKNRWTVVLLKAKNVLDFYIFKDSDKDNLPVRNRIINWILKAIPLDISPQHVNRTVQILLKECKENKEKRKEIASREDCIQAKEMLKKIEVPKLSRPMNQGGLIEGIPYQMMAEKSRTILTETIENLERIIMVLKNLVQKKF